MTPPPLEYANTTVRDGIEDTFAVGPTPVNGHYPLYVGYEDYSAGVDNILLTASYDGGATWTGPIQLIPSTHSSTRHTACATCETTFLGDYFGNDAGPGAHGFVDYTTFVSTYADPTNPQHQQQQIVAKIPVP